MLDPNQAALLRVFEVKMATFRFTLLAAWSADGDVFEELAAADGDDDGEMDDDDDEGEEGAEEGLAGGAFPEGDAAMMLPPGLKAGA